MATAVPISPGTPVLSGWCDSCALPSVVTVPVNALTPTGVHTVGTVKTCSDCKGKL